MKRSSPARASVGTIGSAPGPVTGNAFMYSMMACLSLISTTPPLEDVPSMSRLSMEIPASGSRSGVSLSGTGMASTRDLRGLPSRSRAVNDSLPWVNFGMAGD